MEHPHRGLWRLGNDTTPHSRTSTDTTHKHFTTCCTQSPVNGPSTSRIPISRRIISVSSCWVWPDSPVPCRLSDRCDQCSNHCFRRGRSRTLSTLTVCPWQTVYLRTRLGKTTTSLAAQEHRVIVNQFLPDCGRSSVQCAIPSAQE